MRKIKVAQIGTSRHSHGNQVFRSLIHNSDIFEIVGYALPENEREKFPEKVKVFDGYKELTVDEILNNKEIEAVVVETEEIYLTKYALMAVNAGKHIHMEKPGSQSLADFEKLISLVKQKDVKFHTGYMYRYNPYVIDLYNQIENGEFGDIISVEAHMSCTHTKDHRNWLETFKGGMMFYLGCHLIDLVYRIQGKPEKIVPFNRSSGIEGVNVEDFCMSVFDYKNSVSIVKTTDVDYGGFSRRHLTVTGTKKTVEIRPLEMVTTGENIFTTKTDYKSLSWSDCGQTVKTDEFNRYDAMLESFGRIVLGEKENPYTPDYELELFKLILECCEVK